MRNGFRSELDELQEDILKMGTKVETIIYESLKSLANGDLEMAKRLIAEDDAIDRMELEIEKKCLTMLALQAPLAGDLRVVGTALKLITDLERMADHAADIAKVTIRLDGQALIKPLIDLPRMAELARGMLRDALWAFTNRDAMVAMKVIRQDDEVDSLYKQVFRELLVLMIEETKNINQATQLLFVAHRLERIADHATNLGEWVHYMVTGVRKPLRASGVNPV